MRHPLPFGRLAQETQDAGRVLRIQPGRRLVRQDDARGHEERSGRRRRDAARRRKARWGARPPNRTGPRTPGAPRRASSSALPRRTSTDGSRTFSRTVRLRSAVCPCGIRPMRSLRKCERSSSRIAYRSASPSRTVPARGREHAREHGQQRALTAARMPGDDGQLPRLQRKVERCHRSKDTAPLGGQRGKSFVREVASMSMPLAVP